MRGDKELLVKDFHRLTVVTPSQWLADRVGESFFKNFPLEVIPNGLDEQVFQPIDFEALVQRHDLGGRKVILAVAPNLMSRRKGGRWVVDLARRLLGRPYKFVLIGVDDPGRSFPENVIALRHISRQSELAAYYSVADVTLLVSEKETFSMVCAESLCCGTPIVGFEAGAPMEVAPAGYGRFVPYGDLEALEKAVVGIMSGREPLASPEACLSFGRRRYTRGIMAGKYLALYASSLSPGRIGPG
jgi:glycosyltransferase involved in cell wall biosynthesis